MKRLLLGAAIAALFATQALAQTHELQNPCHPPECSEGANGECIAVSVCNLNPEVIAVGQRIGFTKLTDLTSAASVMDGATIENRGNLYVSELLRSLPGVSVNASGPGSGLTQIRLRGTEASHVLVLIDGVEVSNPAAGEFDFSGLRAEDIERIEVLRGEQSALYGSDAVGGVINIITRAGNSRKSFRASVEGGSRETIDGQISAVIPFGRAALSINGNAFNTEGYDISGLGGETDGSQSRSLNIGLNNIELGGLAFSAKASTSVLDVEFDGDTDFDGRLNNTLGETTVDTQTARVDARFDLAGFENLITLSHLKTETDTRGGFSSLSIGKRTNLNWAAKREFGDNAFTLLAEGEKESYQISPNFTEAGANPDNTVYALAGDYRYNKGPLTLTASARHDINDLFQDTTTWRAGGGYAFESLGGRLRASVGTGLKNPSLIELFGFFPQSNFTGNPDLEPETSLGFNIGYEQKISHLTLSADYFHSDLKDEIFTQFNPDFSSTVLNRTTGSKREGIEFEAQWTDNNVLTANASATLLEAEENGVKEIRRPEFLASATVTWTPIDTVSLTASVDHTGAQTDTDFATFSPVTLDSFTLVGLNAAYDVGDHFTLTLRGENLLDETYQEVVGYAPPGRAVYAGLKANFD